MYIIHLFLFENFIVLFYFILCRSGASTNCSWTLRDLSPIAFAALRNMSDIGSSTTSSSSSSSQTSLYARALCAVSLRTTNDAATALQHAVSPAAFLDGACEGANSIVCVGRHVEKILLFLFFVTRFLYFAV